MLTPIQVAYQASPEWQEIALQAYPPPPDKKKKEKNKGTRHPGGDKINGSVEAKPDGSVAGSDAAQVSVGKDVDDAMKNLDIQKS